MSNEKRGLGLMNPKAHNVEENPVTSTKKKVCGGKLFQTSNGEKGQETIFERKSL